MNVAKFLSGLQPKQLVGLYNLLNPSKTITKFESRPVGEARTAECIKTQGPYPQFFSDFAAAVADLGFELPAPRESKPKDPAPEVVTKRAARGPKTVSTPKAHKDDDKPGEEKKPSLPHVLREGYQNVRCPKCGYFAKTVQQMMDLGRLKCPVDGEVLLTAEERGETRGKYKRSAK